MGEVKINYSLARRFAQEEAEKRVLLRAHGVQTRARLLAPVDTGRLRDSIQVDRIKWDLYRVSTGVEYAAFVEFGTRYMPAQPYLTPAYKAVVGV
jgi:HK97 gp10 family phage protein